MLDQGAYFEGQQRYEFKSLLEESADEAFQHLFVTPLRSLAHSYQHLIITEAYLQSSGELYTYILKSVFMYNPPRVL
jgi:hypothetical protein